MFKNTLIGFAALTLVFAQSSFALTIKKQRLLFGSRVVGVFDNGAKFIIERSHNGPSSVVFEKDGVKKILSNEKVAYAPDTDPSALSEDRNYTASKHDKAVVLETGNKSYLLTDKGVFVSLFEDYYRFSSGPLGFRADIRVGDEFYALVSCGYNEAYTTGAFQTGETLVVRLSDGKTALFDREYRTGFGGMSQRDHEIGVPPVYFNLNRFEQEAVDRARKYALVEPKRSKEVTGAPKNSVKDGVFEFVNESELQFKRGPEEQGVYFKSPNGEVKKIIDERPLLIPGTQDIRDYTYAAFADQKLVTIATPSGVWLVNDQGEKTLIPAHYEKIASQNGIYSMSERALAHNGIQYTLISFDYGVNVPKESPKSKKSGDKKSGKFKNKAIFNNVFGGEDEESGEQESPSVNGETFIVRQDGKMTRVDFKKHLFSLGNEVFGVDRGVLWFKHGTRNIDLDAFDAELKFNAQLGSMDPDAALEQLDSLLRYETDSALKRDLTYEHPDPKVQARIRQAFYKEGAQSVVLLGEAGSMAEREAENFVALAVQGKIKGFPRSWPFYRLDQSLYAGASYVGMTESRNQVVISASMAAPIVFFAPNIETIRGSGAGSSGNSDFIQSARSSIAKGEIRILAYGQLDSYNHALRGDSQVDQAIERVVVGELSKEDTLKLGSAWLKKHGYPEPEAGAFDHLYQMSGARVVTGAQPGNFLSELDRVYAFKRNLGEEKIPLSVKDLEGLLVQEGADPGKFRSDAREKRLGRYWDVMRTRLIGNEFALGMGFMALEEALTGMNDDTKTTLFFLLLGKEGAGKTEYAQALAEVLGVTFQRFNMVDEHSPQGLLKKIAGVLTKDPDAVLLFDEIEKAPVDVQSVLLSIGDSGQFQVEENLGVGQNSGVKINKVNAKRAHFIFTANAAAEFVAKTFSGAGEIKTQSIGFNSNSETPKPTQTMAELGKNITKLRKTLTALKAEAKNSGLSRYLVDRSTVLPMTPPSRDEFRAILKLHLDRTLKSLGTKHGFEAAIENEKEFLDVMVEENYQPQISGREALEIVKLSVRTALATAKRKGIAEAGHKLVLEYKDGWVQVRTACEALLQAK